MRSSSSTARILVLTPPCCPNLRRYGEHVGGSYQRDQGEAAERWSRMLADWAIPPEILSCAPESPYVLSPAMFAAPEAAADSDARRVALDVLGELDSPSVLDVGCGAGRASTALVPPASRLVGVDERQTMLDAFTAAGVARGVECGTVLGTWPDARGALNGETFDVVVCHHVLYNVAELVPFVRALAECARRRVVLEITAAHPWAGMDKLYRHFWKLPRPSGPSWFDAAGVIEGDAGLQLNGVAFATLEGPRWANRADHVRFVARRLCLPADRDPEVDAVLDELAPPAQRRVVAMWFDV